MLRIDIVVYLVVALAVAGIGYAVYEKIYDRGYQAAVTKCDERFNDFQRKVDAKLQEVTESISSIGTKLDVNKSNLTKDLANLQQILKNQKPAVVVVDNKCVLTSEYVNTVNQMIQRINQDRKKSK